MTENKNDTAEASYDNFVLCESLWKSALEIYNSDSEDHGTQAKALLEKGFGSILAAGGHILYETADILTRIDSTQISSRKQTEKFAQEIDALRGKAEMFEKLSSYMPERRKLGELWQSEYPLDMMMPDISMNFKSNLSEILDEALRGLRRRNYRSRMAQTLQRICWYFEEGKN